MMRLVLMVLVAAYSILASVTLHAQTIDSTERDWIVGVFGGVNHDQQVTHTYSLYYPPNGFSYANGTGMHAGFLLEQSLKSFNDYGGLFVIARAFYQSMNGGFTTYSGQTVTDTVYRENNLRTSLTYYNLNLSIEYNIGPQPTPSGFHFSLGPTIGILRYAELMLTKTVTKNATNTTVTTDSTFSVPSTNKFRFALAYGIGWDFRLTSDWMLSASGTLEHPFSQLTPVYNWSTQSILGSLAIKYFLP
jgi:hypothetical protein